MAKKQGDDLELVIVTYNSEFWLKKLLISLENHYLKQTKNKVKVTVVDNASDDETVTLINKEFKYVNLIKMTENLGFAAANNQALKNSTAKYIMLLNSDTELLAENNLDQLIDYLDKNPKVGVITPRLEFINGELDTACHRGEPTMWASFAYFSKLSSIFPNSKLFAQYHQTYKDFSSTHEIDACSGAAMMFRKSLLDKVGLLDERFFMYAEDLDFCRRIREAGFKVIYFPDVRVIHHKNKSGIKSSSQKLAFRTRQHFYDTMLQYYDKYYRNKYPEVVRQLVKFVLILKKGAI